MCQMQEGSGLTCVGTLALAVACSGMFLLSGAVGRELAMNFDDSAAGAATPARMRFEPPSLAKWFVREDGGGRVIAQEALLPSHSIALVDGARFGDVSISARMIGTSGHRVQGLVWRFQDPKNFFLIRAEGGDPEGRVVPEIRTDLYYRGKRIPLGGKVRVAGLDVTRWFRLKAVHQGKVIRMYLDDKKVAELNDGYWCTLLPGDGAVGFYTMRETTARFDDLVVRPVR